jgi:hypothetical protein
MKPKIFKSETFGEFNEEFKLVFSGQISDDFGTLFVNCPVRMGKTYNAQQFIIRFLKNVRDNSALNVREEIQAEVRELLKRSGDAKAKKGETSSNEIVIFCTEKNVLVDGAYVSICENLTETERDSLLVFKKETSNRSNKQLAKNLSQESYRVACLCSFAYLSGGRTSQLVKTVQKSNAKVTIIVDEAEALLNQLLKETTICRGIDRNFGSKPRGNLTKALDDSKNMLSNIVSNMLNVTVYVRSLLG